MQVKALSCEEEATCEHDPETLPIFSFKMENCSVGSQIEVRMEPAERWVLE